MNVTLIARMLSRIWLLRQRNRSLRQNNERLRRIALVLIDDLHGIRNPHPDTIKAYNALKAEIECLCL